MQLNARSLKKHLVLNCTYLTVLIMFFPNYCKLLWNDFISVITSLYEPFILILWSSSIFVKTNFRNVSFFHMSFIFPEKKYNVIDCFEKTLKHTGIILQDVSFASRETTNFRNHFQSRLCNQHPYQRTKKKILSPKYLVTHRWGILNGCFF